MSLTSSTFVPSRRLGTVTNHIPLQVRFIKSRKENLIHTCTGKQFNTYGISHFGLLTVSDLHDEEITALACDTYHVYTASGTEIYAWRRGTEIKHCYRSHNKPVHLILPFGVHLISVDEDNMLKVFDIKDETVFLELSFGAEDFKITTILHPSTYINKILLGSEQGELQLWNIHTSRMIYLFKGWKSPVVCLEQAPAIDVVAIGLMNGKIVLHNLKFDQTITEFTQDYGLITSISFRDNIMATGSPGGMIVFWNLENGRVSGQLQAHSAPVSGLHFLPNEPLLLTSSPDNSLKLWIFDDVEKPRLLRIRQGHPDPPSLIRFRDLDNILSVSPDSTLRIFHVRNEQFNKSMGVARFKKSTANKIKSDDSKLKMPPITTFAAVDTRSGEWDDIAAAHQGMALVTSWSFKRVKMGDLKLLPERFHKKNREAEATCLCLTSCGNFVLIGYNTGHVDRFNIQSGLWRDTYNTPKGHKGPVRGVATDVLNQLSITGGSDSTIKFFKFKCKGAPPLNTLSLEEPVSFFRAHASMIAVALENYEVCVIDIDTRRLVRRFYGHTCQVTDAAFSPDARNLITSSMDCTVKIWDVPSSLLIDQIETESPCVTLDVSPSGEAMVTAHVDNVGICLWVNRSIYERVTPKSISGAGDSNKSQIRDLVTLSDLAPSRWQNCLNVDIIRSRNKPKNPVKRATSAPFFLPTVSSLNSFRFSLGEDKSGEKDLLGGIKLLSLASELDKVLATLNFSDIVDKLKTYGPLMLDSEIKSMAVDSMLSFLKTVEFMLKSCKDFELAQMYLAVFLKIHGTTVAQTDILRNYLPNVQSCSNVVWERLRERFMYNLCLVKNCK